MSGGHETEFMGVCPRGHRTYKRLRWANEGDRVQCGADNFGHPCLAPALLTTLPPVEAPAKDASDVPDQGASL